MTLVNIPYLLLMLLFNIPRTMLNNTVDSGHSCFNFDFNVNAPFSFALNLMLSQRVSTAGRVPGINPEKH